MNYLKKSIIWFQEQSKYRQWSLVTGIVFISLITSVLMYWALSPGYGILFNHLDGHDANQILTRLDEANISYQLRNQGHDILIDKKLIDKTRIKLMSSELGLTHSVGFELFDKTDFGMTDFSQQINYQRALQGELERTISSLDEIKQARVHLVIPEHHLFQQEENQPRVAVTLHLKQALTKQQVKSIQQLITASVAHLKVTNVVIVDQNGNSLSQKEEESSSSHFAAKKSIEQYLNDKVMQMLHRVFTHENVLVKIDATLNYDELHRELIKPKSNGLITHEKESQHTTTANKSDKKPANHDVTREKSYELGQEKERFTRANGTIERLTISVVLPKTTDKEQLKQIERLVKSVVGYDASRGDSISVEALIEEHGIANATIEPLIPKPIKSNNVLQMLVAGGLLVFLLIAFLHQRIRRRQKHLMLAELNEWLIERG